MMMIITYVHITVDTIVISTASEQGYSPKQEPIRRASNSQLTAHLEQFAKIALYHIKSHVHI